jgi:hypothetical protein
MSHLGSLGTGRRICAGVFCRADRPGRSAGATLLKMDGRVRFSIRCQTQPRVATARIPGDSVETPVRLRSVLGRLATDLEVSNLEIWE